MIYYVLSRACIDQLSIRLQPRNASIAHPNLQDMTCGELSFYSHYLGQLRAGYHNAPQLTDETHRFKALIIPILKQERFLLKPLQMCLLTQQPQSSESTAKKCIEREEDPYLFTLSPCVFKIQWWEKVCSLFPQVPLRECI